MEKTIHIAPDGELETEPDNYASTVAKTDTGDRLLKLDNDEWIFYPDENRWGWAMQFQNERDARLYFGLWLETGGFDTPESPSKYVPVEIVKEGKDAVAAYLLIGYGVKNSRRLVSEILGVTEQTVSNYANRIRWKGGNDE